MNGTILRRLIYLLALLQLLLLGSLAGLPELWGASEAREAHFAKIMWEDGEWIAPRRFGFVPSKPPLFHWLSALLGGGLQQGVQLFSDTPVSFPGAFAARFVSACFASGVLLLSLFLTYSLRRRFDAPTSSQLFRCIMCSAFITCTTYGFMRLAVDARVDMTFGFFVFAALCSVLIKYPQINWNTFFIACGGAVLTKGPLGIVLPLYLCGITLWYMQGFKSACREMIRPRLGWLWFLLLATPWYYAAYRLYGSEIISRQFLFENVERLVGSEKTNAQAPWYYIPAFLANTAPWSVLLLLFAVRQKNMPQVLLPVDTARADPRRLLSLLPWLVAAGIFLLSLASGKRHSYLLPLFPLLGPYLAVHIDAWLFSKFGAERGGLLPRLAQALCWILVLLAAGLELPFDFWTQDAAVLQGLAWLEDHSLTLQLFLFAAAALLFVCKKRHPALATWIGIVAIFSFSLALGQGMKGGIKGFEKAGPLIAKLVVPEKQLVVVRTREEEFLDPVLYYLDLHGQILPFAEALDICPDQLLTTGDYLLQFQNKPGKTFVEQGRWSLIADQKNPNHAREMVLVRCHKGNI